MCWLDFGMDTLWPRLNNEILTVAGIVGILFVILLHLFFVRKNGRTNKKLAHTIKQLEQTNQLKDRFFSIISHDLKGPFNGILGLSNYLQEEFEGLSETEKKELIIDINIASKSAFNLLQNLLNWARTQTGTIVFHPTSINTKQIVDFSLETVMNYARHKQIEIKLNIEPELTFISDENMVSTILRNLVENSVKFSPRNSTIEIEAKKLFNQIIFSVKDQGIGFTEEEINKLFRIEIHFHKKGTEQEPGTGLGLLLCNDLTQRLDGKLWVTSKHGEGSTFFFALPLKNEKITPL
jgi:two-component system, sensor histidine kinase and response regulator